jgi:hypothetical protein
MGNMSRWHECLTIEQTAQQILDIHGAEALEVASDWIEMSDAPSAKTWRKIAAEIERLQRL